MNRTSLKAARAFIGAGLFLGWIVTTVGCRAPTLVSFSYTIVGGKPSAPTEVLRVDCDAGTADFERRAADGRVTGAGSFTLQRVECEKLQALAGATTSRSGGTQQGVADAATFTLSWLESGVPRRWSWTGALTDGAGALQEFHTVTRELLRARLPDQLVY